MSGLWRRAHALLPRRGPSLFLAFATAGGALARFATLDLQSFGHDEAVTVLHVVRPGLLDTLEAVAERERNGPLYYTLAWLWSLMSPPDEVGFRSLPALFGTLTIPVAYLAASELASRRAGAIAAVLVAANPFLVWYSQEARSYALVVLLGALSLLFLARALNRPARNGADLALWAAASAAALASHYFALFVVVPEALWLLYALRSRRAAAAVAASAAVGAALLPLALHQSGQRSGLFADTGLLNRLLESGAKFSAGNELSLFPELTGAHVAGAAVSAVAAALWLAGLGLLRRERRSGGRPGGLMAAGIGFAGLALPAALALAGLDLVNARNLVVGIVPLLVGAACGFGARGVGRVGAAAAAMLALAFLANLALVTSDPALQRRDFRDVAQKLGEPDGERLILASRLAVPQLSLYAHARRERRRALPTSARGEPVLRASEIALVAPGGGRGARPSRGEPLRGEPAFRLAERHSVPGYDVLVYRADRLRSLPFSSLSQGRLAGSRPAILSAEDRPG